MTNLDTAKAATGVAISATGMLVSRLDQIEQWSRIIASWVAIASGVVVIWFTVYKHYKSRKHRKNHEKNKNCPDS